MGASEDGRRRRTAGPGWTRSSSATRRSSTCASSTSDGRAMRQVRQAVRRVERAGYTVPDPAARRRSRRARWPSSSADADALARQRDRARLLDGARPARRPGRRRVRAGRGARRATAGGAACCRFVPWGRRRPVARPDAARPRRRQRAGRVHGRRARRGGRRARRGPGLAELRHVPGGVRARARRIGAGPVMPAVADGCCCSPRMVLAARVAVPVQREVPPGVGAAVPVLRADRATWPGSAWPWASPRASLAEPAFAAPAATCRRRAAGARRSGPCRPTESADAAAAADRAACRSRCGCAGAKLDRLRERRRRPVPGRASTARRPPPRSGRDPATSPRTPTPASEVAIAGRVMLGRATTAG